MKRIVLALALALGVSAAVIAQTPPPAQTTPFKCPPGMAGQETTAFRGVVLTGTNTSPSHYAIVKYPPAGRCGQEPPLEGFHIGGKKVIEPTYAAMHTFSADLAVARRTDGAHVFIDLATKAERPFPYIRYLRNDIAAFGIVSDDPATQTSTVAYLSFKDGEPAARFERIIGVIGTENVASSDGHLRAIGLRQRQADGSERVLWVNTFGQVNTTTPPVTELRSGYARELVEIVGPSPFPAVWPEMFRPLQGTGQRWPLPPGVLGFAPHPLEPGRFVTFVQKDGKTLINTGATPFFRFPDQRRNWGPDTSTIAWFENMAVVKPAQQPVDEYKAERFLVARALGAAGWKPLKMELPDPAYTRASPQLALDEAIVAYNARMAAGGAAQLEARRAAETAASARLQAEWDAKQAAEAARYDALVKKAAAPNARLNIGEESFIFDHEAATFKSGFRETAPKAWAEAYGRKLAADLRRNGTPMQHAIRDAERLARTAGPGALTAFQVGAADMDPQSKVMLCSAGRREYCYQPPAAAAHTAGPGYAPNVAGDISASLEAFKAREAAINASNCARASLGYSIGCNQ